MRTIFFGSFRRRRFSFIAAVPLLLLLSMCGLDDYTFLDRVTEQAISVPTDVHAEIALPAYTVPQTNYFTRFVFYYRIYLSDTNTTGRIQPASFSTINSALAADYAALLPYTDPSSTVSVTNIAAQFSYRNYYEVMEIDGLMGNGPGTVNVEFDTGYIAGLSLSLPPPVAPVAVRGTITAQLRRSTGYGAFQLRPSDLFLATPELFSTPVSITVNRDVQASSSGAPAYAYVSLYIVTQGQNDTDLSPVYSRPTFIGVFSLPPP
ncbi:MAG: hypothetical protein LBC88_04035 [Spirochaetaceae bacterium]|nr:hypothetical protein [Spirochaetaceae bacterium]